MTHIIGSKAVGLVAGMAGQFFSLGTETNLFDWIKREVSSGEEIWFDDGSLPGMNAIQRLAPAVICCHNHPSTDPIPSLDNVAITRAMVRAGKLLDIILLDHLFIVGGWFMSLKERSLGFD